MLVEAIVILLVIMLLSNVALRIYNQINPPCSNDVEEYFASARKLPDGISAGLGSIPSGTDVKHVGFKTEASPDGGIKLTSHKYETPKFLEGDEFDKAIAKAFPSNFTDSDTMTGKKVEEVNGRLVVFDENEGMTAGNKHRPARRSIISSSGFVKRIERDGYSDACPNDW
jgi:hypothetical protein